MIADEAEAGNEGGADEAEPPRLARESAARAAHASDPRRPETVSDIAATTSAGAAREKKSTSSAVTACE